MQLGAGQIALILLGGVEYALGLSLRHRLRLLRPGLPVLSGGLGLPATATSSLLRLLPLLPTLRLLPALLLPGALTQCQLQVPLGLGIVRVDAQRLTVSRDRII